MSYEHITEACLDAFQDLQRDALALLERLMDRPGVPMHDPIHHYIMPAALLTVASRKCGKGREELVGLLRIAEERARKLLPGFCGWWGACGSAVGCGVFASVWTGASPKKEEHWAQSNAFTARCLEKVASVDGPRCCKRTSYLALPAAIPASRELLGLDLGPIPEPACTWSAFNKECRKDGCPFYQKETNVRHVNLICDYQLKRFQGQPDGGTSGRKRSRWRLTELRKGKRPASTPSGCSSATLRRPSSCMPARTCPNGASFSA